MTNPQQEVLHPRFSVLVPVFNRVDFVRQAIDSVLCQTFTDFEVLAVDDGSTDNSLAILESYGPRITLIHQDNLGQEVARNNAARLARGEYFVMLDSDDLLLPRALATYDRIIREFDAPPLIIGSLTSFRQEQELAGAAKDESEIQVLQYADYFSKDVMVLKAGSSIVMKRDVFEAVGGYGIVGTSPAPDDIDMILAVGTLSPCIVVVKPGTVGYRDHPARASRSVKEMAKGILRLVRFERQGRYPGGRARRADRYATLGGFAGNYAYRYCWLERHRTTALKIFLGAAPIIVSAYRQKLLRKFRPPTSPIVLPSD